MNIDPDNLKRNYEELLIQNAMLVKALGELLRSCPHNLGCDDFHHSKKDLHEFDGPCIPANRYIVAMANASVALGSINADKSAKEKK